MNRKRKKERKCRLLEGRGKKCQAVLTETKYLEASFLWETSPQNLTEISIYHSNEAFPNLFSLSDKNRFFCF